MKIHPLIRAKKMLVHKDMILEFKAFDAYSDGEMVPPRTGNGWTIYTEGDRVNVYWRDVLYERK